MLRNRAYTYALDLQYTVILGGKASAKTLAMTDRIVRIDKLQMPEIGNIDSGIDDSISDGVTQDCMDVGQRRTEKWKNRQSALREMPVEEGKRSAVREIFP